MNNILKPNCQIQIVCTEIQEEKCFVKKVVLRIGLGR